MSARASERQLGEGRVDLGRLKSRPFSFARRWPVAGARVRGDDWTGGMPGAVTCQRRARHGQSPVMESPVPPSATARSRFCPNYPRFLCPRGHVYLLRLPSVELGASPPPGFARGEFPGFARGEFHAPFSTFEMGTSKAPCPLSLFRLPLHLKFFISW